MRGRGGSWVPGRGGTAENGGGPGSSPPRSRPWPGGSCPRPQAGRQEPPRPPSVPPAPSAAAGDGAGDRALRASLIPAAPGALCPDTRAPRGLQSWAWRSRPDPQRGLGGGGTGGAPLAGGGQAAARPCPRVPAGAPWDRPPGPRGGELPGLASDRGQPAGHWAGVPRVLSLRFRTGPSCRQCSVEDNFYTWFSF